MDALAHQALGRERVFHERADLLAETDEWLMLRFRLPQTVLLHICHLLEPQLGRQTRRSKPIPPHVQILTTTGFLSMETSQREIWDRSGVSQSSDSRALPLVIKGLIRLAPRYIKFPYTAFEQVQIKREFYAIAGLPNINRATDCTHKSIKAPSPEAFPFLNRKQYHSINVQIISDSSHNLLNVVARWSGGAQYSFMLQNSAVGTRLAQGAHGDGWLIGKWLVNWQLSPCKLFSDHFLKITIFVQVIEVMH